MGLRRREFLTGAAALAVLPAVAGCGSLEGAARGDRESAWRITSSMPGDAGNAHSEWLAAFEEALDGAVALEAYPDNQLGDEAKIVQQVQIGAVDVMIGSSSIWSTVAPEYGLLDLGYLFDEWPDVAAALDGEVGTALARILRSQTGVQVLGWPFNFGARNVLSERRVSGPEDLRGVKVRTLPAAEVVETLDLMGAVATPIAFSEVYTSLQTGLIDGLEHDAPTIERSKFYEVAKELALTRHIFNPLAVVANGDSLAALAPDQRERVLVAARTATRAQRAQVEGAEALAALVEQGVAVRRVDRRAFREAVRPLWSSYVETYPSARPILARIQIPGG